MDGFFSVEVDPLPKFHCQAVGLPVDKSWKLITIGEQPAVCVAVKLAVGAWDHAIEQIAIVSNKK